MITRRTDLHDDSNARVAAYESLLDLFTLISFLLILAAFIYVARASGGDKNWASVAARITERGSGTPRAIPSSAFLIVLSRENSNDLFWAVSGATGFKTNSVVTPQTITGVLGTCSLELANLKIYVSLYEPKEKVNPGVMVEAQRWLAYHGFNDWRLYFVP